jgi:hypothetical protein
MVTITRLGLVGTGAKMHGIIAAGTSIITDARWKEKTHEQEQLWCS